MNLCSLFDQVMEEEKTQQNSYNIGNFLLTELAKLRDEFDIVGDVRGKGLMIGVEMVNTKVMLVSFYVQNSVY